MLTQCPILYRFWGRESLFLKSHIVNNSELPPILLLLILLGSVFVAAINMEMNDCGCITERFIYKNRWWAMLIPPTKTQGKHIQWIEEIKYRTTWHMKLVSVK